jgi:hypothetical protein
VQQVLQVLQVLQVQQVLQAALPKLAQCEQQVLQGYLDSSVP